MSVNGWIWTKSRFLGLAIAVDMIGKATITLHDLHERYSISFPTGYGRYDHEPSMNMCAIASATEPMQARVDCLMLEIDSIRRA